MRIRVGDISKINELSLLKNDSFDTILYLDTSNLTENKVDTLQKIDLSIDKLPSRAKRKVRKNTILFSNVRPIQRHYGLLEETPNNLIVSTGFTTLNPDDSVIDEYFLYYLLTQDSTINYLQMIAENSVSSYPSITSNDIADLNFVIPDSIEEQKRTVKIIKLIDQKISLNNQINEELEAMAKTLYDYWFVQFDFPNENGKPYKSSGGKMVYNDQLKREIPEGWGVETLSGLGTIVGGSTPSKSNLDNFVKSGQGISWITPNDLSKNKGNKFISKGEIDISEVGRLSANLKIFPKGTVLLSSRAPIGYLAIASNELTTNQGFKSFIPNKEYDENYIYYVIKQSMKVIEQNASGSTFKEISSTVLGEILVVKPKIN
ncbi:TPA: restriction endonuclease subunit S, partial [Streptococcus suis]